MVAKSLLEVECIWFIYIMEYHLAIALNKLELYVSAQINLKNIMLSKKYLV